MKRLMLCLLFAVSGELPLAYAEPVCEPLARGLENLADTSLFGFIGTHDDYSDAFQLTLVGPFGGISYFNRGKLWIREERAFIEKALRERAKQLRDSEVCVAQREKKSDDPRIRIFAPDGEEDQGWIWVRKKDGRVTFIVDRREKFRVLYPW